MIFSKEGEAIIYGSGSELLADLTIVMERVLRSIKNEDGLYRETIEAMHRAVTLAGIMALGPDRDAINKSFCIHNGMSEEEKKAKLQEILNHVKDLKFDED